MRLYANINHAKSFTKELNKKLSGMHFGKDTYKICVTNTKDSEYGKIYKMIKNISNAIKEDPNSSFFETDFFKYSYKKEVDIFSEEIIHSMKIIDESEREKALAKILDYRNYLNFDIKKNETISLDIKLGSDSGGEAQTAYYVILAAAFANIYNEHSISLVMIDEAFDKIDDNRKGEVLKFYKDLNFQCILTTPHVSPFINQADMLISVLKSDKQAYANSEFVRPLLFTVEKK